MLTGDATINTRHQAPVRLHVTSGAGSKGDRQPHLRHPESGDRVIVADASRGDARAAIDTPPAIASGNWRKRARRAWRDGRWEEVREDLAQERTPARLSHGPRSSGLIRHFRTYADLSRSRSFGAWVTRGPESPTMGVETTPLRRVHNAPGRRVRADPDDGTSPCFVLARRRSGRRSRPGDTMVVKPVSTVAGPSLWMAEAPSGGRRPSTRSHQLVKPGRRRERDLAGARLEPDKQTKINYGSIVVGASDPHRCPIG